MTYEVTRQSDKILPPEDAKMLVIAVDSTSRTYDLSLCNLGGRAFGDDRDRNEWFYVTLSADGGNVYYDFSAASGKTVDDTAALSAGSAVSGFTTNGCDVVFSGTKDNLYINRTDHRYLNIKTSSGTAKLRLHVSSDLLTGSTT